MPAFSFKLDRICSRLGTGERFTINKNFMNIYRRRFIHFVGEKRRKEGCFLAVLGAVRTWLKAVLLSRWRFYRADKNDFKAVYACRKVFKAKRDTFFGTLCSPCAAKGVDFISIFSLSPLFRLILTLNLCGECQWHENLRRKNQINFVVC